MKLLFTDPFFFGHGSAGDYLIVFIYAVVGFGKNVKSNCNVFTKWGRRMVKFC